MEKAIFDYEEILYDALAKCLSTAYRIKGDFESWYSEWLATAERVSKYGDDSLSSGHKVSAREAYLRAFNYYRNAEFFLHTNPQDPRIIETWQKSVDSFKKAAQMFLTKSNLLKSHMKEQHYLDTSIK
jgi:hypothetical protein